MRNHPLLNYVHKQWKVITMLKAQRDIASFVLRFTQELWEDTNGEPQVEWRGEVHHVQGGEESRFTDFAEAVAFMQHHLMQLTQNAVAGSRTMDPEKTMQESFKLWQNFADTYTDMMFGAMERTMEQSEAFRKQMDEAVERTMQAWQPAASSNQDEVLQALKNLQSQVQTLSKKIDKLEKSLKTDAS